MRMSRCELEKALDALQTSIPFIKTWGSREAQVATFNADAHAIRWSAAHKDADYLVLRLDKMLHSSWLEAKR